MGKRGPQPQPTALKLERGTPGHRPLNNAEPDLPAPKGVAPPKGMKGRARTEWIRLAADLVSRGVLTVGDMHAFEEYCTLVGEVDHYEKEMVHNRTAAHTLGYANYLLKLRTQLRQQAAHLGLTPSSRSGVKAVKVVATKSAAATKRERFFGTGDRPA